MSVLPWLRRPGEPPPRVGLIDVGTNTALLTVLAADDKDARRLTVLEDLHVVTGLGKGRGPDGSLAEAGRRRAMGALRHYSRRLDELGVAETAVRGAATAAVREAPGGAAFLEEVRQETGLELRCVRGEEEAELVALAQERSFPRDLPLLVVDIGGGSTEIALRESGHTAWKTSIPTGSVKLTERCGADLDALRRTVAKELAAAPPLREAATLVGVAGTVTTALQVASEAPLWDPDALHGGELSRSTLAGVRARLVEAGPEGRRRVPGLHPGRADYIVAGLVLLEGVMDRYDADVVRTSDRGVRFGLLWEAWPRSVVT